MNLVRLSSFIVVLLAALGNTGCVPLMVVGAMGMGSIGSSSACNDWVCGPLLVELVPTQDCMAARRGDGAAAFRVGHYYERIKDDPLTALEWYIFARENGSGVAQVQIDSVQHLMTAEQISEVRRRTASESPDSLPCD